MKSTILRVNNHKINVIALDELNYVSHIETHNGGIIKFTNPDVGELNNNIRGDITLHSYALVSDGNIVIEDTTHGYELSTSMEDVLFGEVIVHNHLTFVLEQQAPIFPTVTEDELTPKMNSAITALFKDVHVSSHGAQAILGKCAL